MREIKEAYMYSYTLRKKDTSKKERQKMKSVRRLDGLTDGQSVSV